MRIKKVPGVNSYMVLTDYGEHLGNIDGPWYCSHGEVVLGDGTRTKYVGGSFETYGRKSFEPEQLEFIIKQVSGIGTHCFEYEFEDGRLSRIDGEKIE